MSAITHFCSSHKDISGWAIDPMGTHAAGWGLTLTPMDLAKIGQLYLNGGMWEGKQIISSKWVGSIAHPLISVDLLNAICSSLLSNNKLFSTLIPSGSNKFSDAKSNTDCPVALIKIPDKMSGPFWAVISEWRHVGGEADHFFEMGRGEYDRTQQMEKRKSVLWIFVVGK